MLCRINVIKGREYCVGQYVSEKLAEQLVFALHCVVGLMQCVCISYGAIPLAKASNTNLGLNRIVYVFIRHSRQKDRKWKETMTPISRRTKRHDDMYRSATLSSCAPG